ncbi:hypothetical protein A2U01_0062808, partial [Trifolium medium]|nr:hypothetical protein [Trifolium medium]
MTLIAYAQGRAWQRQQVTLSTVKGEAWALLQAMKEANHR